MISEKEVQKFLSYPAQKGSLILSVYLDMSQPQNDLHRKFELTFKQMIREAEKDLSAEERSSFHRNAKRAADFIQDCRPSGQGLVIFSDDPQDFFWIKETRSPLPNLVRWQTKPFLLPLLEALDEYERYGVILVEKARARLFTYTLGQIEEEEGALALNQVRHFKSTGRDRLLSMRFQQAEEEHVQEHLKYVARRIREISRRHPFDRLVLGGTKQTIDKLYSLMPPPLQRKVVGRIHLPVEAPKKAVEKALILLEKETERKKESELVNQLVRAEAPDEHRILGVEETLHFLEKRRVHKLIYSQNFNVMGSRCTGCGLLFSHRRYLCGNCYSLIEPLEGRDLLEEMARRVVEKGGRIEEVFGEAAQRLDETDGIGAVLKPARQGELR